VDASPSWGPDVPKLRLHLTFPEHLIQEPLIWRLGRQYDVITNIRRANVEEKVGWIILEVEGTEEALDQGIGWLEEMGVQVDRLQGDVVES
jgi:ABC-type methionine transport system ATPase subunit